MDERMQRAHLLYERIVFGGDAGVLPAAERELDAVEADLTLARGRILHARFLVGHTEDPGELPLFERAAELYRSLGDVRGEGESLFWIGMVHQVVRQDDETAVALFERARDLAVRADDQLTLSYVLRHLGISAHTAGRLDTAGELLEESTRLRRKLGFLPGVAANLVGLIYIAAAQGRHAEAAAMVDDAAEIAAISGAHGILTQIEEARAALYGDPR
jgi:hypothetical protein